MFLAPQSFASSKLSPQSKMSFRTEVQRELVTGRLHAWHDLRHHPDLVVSNLLIVRNVRDGGLHPQLRFETKPFLVSIRFLSAMWRCRRPSRDASCSCAKTAITQSTPTR
jgi:hypothetical protein